MSPKTFYSDLKIDLYQDVYHCVNILMYTSVENSNLKYNILLKNWLPFL